MQSELPLHYDVASVSCGRDHTLALLATGKAIGWGGDGSGRWSRPHPTSARRGAHRRARSK